MMMYAISRTDGGVSIMVMIQDVRDVAAEIAKWDAADQAQVVSWKEITEAELPQDRTFRNAWEHTGPAVTVNMPKARDMHRERLRVLRAPLLAELDIAYQRADEDNDQQAKVTIAARKRALRDVTDDPAIEAAQTPEELKAVIPAALNDVAQR